MQENQDLIGYDEIIENSMRTVIYETLKKIEVKGLPGSHYFIISFSTKYPGVKVSKAIQDKYSEEMTIVVQHQYQNLKVTQDHFEISLSFSGKFEKLLVPYSAVTSFADPSMNFGLKFSVSLEDMEGAEVSVIDPKDHANKNKLAIDGVKGKKTSKSKSKVDLSEKIISLDQFRKDKNNDN